MNTVIVNNVVVCGKSALDSRIYTAAAVVIPHTTTLDTCTEDRSLISFDSFCPNLMAMFLTARMTLEANAMSTPTEIDVVAKGFPVKTTAPEMIRGKLRRVDPERDEERTRRCNTALVIGSISLMANVEEAFINAMLQFVANVATAWDTATT